MAVIGDDTTSKAASGVASTGRWPALAATAENLDVSTFASAGSGYVASAGGTTFGQKAATIPTDAAVVVVFGSANDAGRPSATLRRAASEAFSTIRTRAPKAKLVVVGPAIRGGATTSQLTAIRIGLRGAAERTDGTWVDPVGGSWLGAAATAAKTSASLSAADEQTRATRIGKQVVDQLK